MQDGSTASWNDPAWDEQRAALMQDDAGKKPWEVDYTGDPYAARRDVVYCAGCGQWLLTNTGGMYGPSQLQCGFGLCRECWLGTTEKRCIMGTRGAWRYIQETFSGPWVMAVPK